MKEIFKKTFKDLDEIKTKEATKESRQNRGRAFQNLLLDVFESEGILQKRGGHTKDGKSEELDGVIEVYNRIFLVEAKWVASGMAASVLYSFIGKIENKFHGTLGVFISRNQLKKNFLRALNKGRRQSVIVIHGKDVDDLFTGVVTFKEYIEYAFKEISSDNIVHCPVEKYIKLKDIKKSTKVLIEKVEPSDKKGLKFVKEKLFTTPMSSTDLLLELETLSEVEKDVAYTFLLQKYSELWISNLTGDTTFIVKNIDEYLNTHEPKLDTVQKLAPEYYTSLIFKSLPLYTRHPFIEEFKTHYGGLDGTIKKKFEGSILKYWQENFGSYAVENSITDLLKPIWKELSDEFKNELYRGYLDIYVSDRRNNHSQKQFAIELVENNKIPLKITETWLVEKLRVSGRMYYTLSVEKINFIVSTYKGILKLVEPNESKWPKYVLKTLFQIKIFTTQNDTYTLTGSQKILIHHVEGSNGENLMVENIGIRHTYYKGSGNKSYYIDLIGNMENPAYHSNNKILPVNKVFENGVNDRTEIKFENLKQIQLKVVYRLMD